MFFQARTGLALFLAGIIGAAGYTLWDEGPGETRRIVQRNNQVASDMHWLGIAAQEYAQDHNMKYPDATNWEQELRPYVGDVLPDFTLPALRNHKPHRIAINSNIAGHKTSDLLAPASAVLFFESRASHHNAADSLASLPEEGNSIAIGYADSHAYTYPLAWRQQIQEPRFHREALGEFSLPVVTKQ